MGKVLGNLDEVTIGQLDGLAIRCARVWYVVFDSQCFDSVPNQRMSELRHRREQMMFNLIVEICHPPVTPPGLFDVERMKKGILNPVEWTLSDGKMSVGEREVAKDIHGS